VRLTLDENLGRRCRELLLEAGHDVSTAQEQGLCSSPDPHRIAACRDERRCLVSLDLDFANTLLFNPAEYCGIAVLRLPPRPELNDMVNAVHTLMGALGKEDVAGKRWVIRPGRVRIYP